MVDALTLHAALGRARAVILERYEGAALAGDIQRRQLLGAEADALATPCNARHADVLDIILKEIAR